MKSLQQLSFVGLVMALVLTSCTMEKRFYMPGYYTEWNKGVHNPDRQALVVSDKTTEQRQTSVVAQPGTATNTVVNFFAPPVNNENITASGDKNVVMISSPRSAMCDKKVKTVTPKSNSASRTKSFVRKKISKIKRKAEKNNPAGGGKSQIVALLLCIFLGLLGIHRFYLGYTGMGILYLLTAGLFGIGWIIDIILLIIPNGLTPKGKSSYKE